MPSGPADPVDLVLSITVLVILRVNGGRGSAKGLILLCDLSISLSVGSCESRDLEGTKQKTNEVYFIPITVHKKDLHPT